MFLSYFFFFLFFLYRKINKAPKRKDVRLVADSADGGESGSEQENAEFLAGALVGVDEVEGLGVSVADDVFEVGAHVHEFLRGVGGEAGGDDAGTDGYALHGAEDGADAVSGPAARGEACLLAVAECGPEGDGAEGTRGGVGALERDAHEAVAHFAYEMVGGERQLKEEQGLGGKPVVLHAEPDVPAAVPEDGADHHRLRGTGRGSRGGGGGGR